MNTHPNQDWVDRSNAETLYHLERQGRTSPGLVPFLGAGISTAFAFNDWKNLLLSAAPPRLAPRIQKQLGENDYEGAAETLLSNGWLGFAAIKGVLRFSLIGSGKCVRFPTIITTNYDDVLERRLADAGLPYHLLSYQADGPHRGLFYHRSPDDGLRIIERPGSIRKLADAFVVVKLNGGFDRQRHIPESYATARLDYWYLAARIPDVFPVAVQQTLSANPLLFIGSGLAAPDIEALVRFAHKQHPGPRSWAVTFRDYGIEYWRQCGVEIINERLQLYVNELRARLAGNGPMGVAAGTASGTSAGAGPPPGGSVKAKSPRRSKRA